MDRTVIGVDLGGTNLRTAIVSSDGEILDKHKESLKAAGYMTTSISEESMYTFFTEASQIASRSSG